MSKKWLESLRWDGFDRPMHSLTSRLSSICRVPVLSAGLLILTTLAAMAAEDRRERVLKDRAEFQTRSDWVYNDLPKAIEEAKRTGKPLLVVFRCVP